MCPLPQSERHDAPGLVGEAVPGVAAVVEDVVVGLEDAVREPVFAHELPDILDWIELGALGGQRDDGDGIRDREFRGQVPACLIQEKDGVGARRDGGGDFGEVAVHAFAVAARQNDGRALALFRADRAVDIGRRGPLVFWRAWPSAATGPAPGNPVLLANPRFILPPQLYGRSGREARADLRYLGCEVFLKAEMASGA